MSKDPALGPREGVDADPAALLPPGQARVLGVLKRAGESLTLAQVADLAGAHQNTVRPQLDALIERGLVLRTRADSGRRGRPAWLYDEQPDAVAPATELAELAAALAGAVVRHAADPREAALEAGRTWGLQIADDGLDAFEELSRLGFAPVPDSDGTIKLTRCPLLGAARAEPTVICGVHQGLMEGLVSASGGDAGQVELIAFAEPGCCRLRMP